MYICHPREVFLAGYSWFDGKTLYFNTQICSITFCLLAEPQTMLQLKVLMTYALFYCKVSSELVHSVHSLLIYVSSFN